MDITRKAIWYVEAHNRTAPSLDAIAGTCGISTFHLTRTFASVTGVPLMRYVRRRRLSEAARLLAAGSPDILSMALMWGYASHEAFTRAFRDEFGLTPEELRARGNVAGIKLTEALTMHNITKINLEPPRFEIMSPRIFAGLKQIYDCASPMGIPNQWQNFGPYIGKIRGQTGDAAYGVCYDFDDDGNFTYLTAVEVTDTTGLPKEFETLRVPAQRYVVFAHREHVAGIRSTIAAIWSDWFPESGAKAVESPMLERYGRGFNPATGEGGLEIWIAIQ
ncbi:MAG: AraC family transcriptional regulator [Turneriella sp.]|nr:AraC family transcriptional regulator [Turneriella sp.]